MKKLISIKDLQFGMFLDAEAVTEEKDGEEVMADVGKRGERTDRKSRR